MTQRAMKTRKAQQKICQQDAKVLKAVQKVLTAVKQAKQAMKEAEDQVAPHSGDNRWAVTSAMTRAKKSMKKTKL